MKCELDGTTSTSYKLFRFKRASSQGQTELVAGFIEFKLATYVQCEWSTIPLEFESEKKLPGPWMEGGSPMPWPPRSLDITLSLVRIRENHCLPIFNW
ncbi:hypothetical protein TNCV_1546641 [Trichonephila clavipes]|nr:hypothetical protein TNCV_1546641 [Trichonephila clavipes]